MSATAGTSAVPSPTTTTTAMSTRPAAAPTAPGRHPPTSASPSATSWPTSSPTVAPEIPGLPEDGELVHLVVCVTLAVYAAAIVDPEVHALDAGERRTVLVARVGLALAFPDG